MKKKSVTNTVAVTGVVGLGVLGGLTLFGENIKALCGMSADALAGDTVVERRVPRAQGKLEKKKLTDFARENSGYSDGPAVASPTPALAPNPTTVTAQDALSTFAVDVDTASYTWARRLVLEQQTLPAQSGVRIEEWVNAFDYALPSPSDGPFAVHVTGATSPFDETKTLVKVALQGRRVDEESRKPAHLVFLVDVSGSMSGMDRLPLAKRALEVLTKQLRPSDTVAIATYAGSSQVVLEPTSAQQQERILSAIRSLNTGGGTNMGSGMELAYRMAVQQVRAGHTSRVIVLTDGDTNIGPNLRPEQMLESVHAYVKDGVTLTTVGFGLGNYRGDALEQLADKGNGQALYIDSEKAIERVFRQQLMGTLELIAKDVKVQVAFDPKVVRSYRLLGYENRAVADQDFRKDDVDAGEVGSGHAVTALYEVTLTSTRGALGTVSVRGQLPDSGRVFETTTSIAPEAVSRPLESGSADLRFATAVALGADTLRGYGVGSWSLSAIARLAEGATEGKAERREFVDLLRAAERLGTTRSVATVRSYDGY